MFLVKLVFTHLSHILRLTHRTGTLSSKFIFEQLSPESHSLLVHALLAHFQVSSDFQEARDNITWISALQFHRVPNSWKVIIRRWISANPV
jgi:hypothetical protein